MSNFPQMMPQMAQQQQQRPNAQQTQTSSLAIQQLIFSTLNNQTTVLNGWQASTLLQERVGLIFKIGNLRLASQHQPNPPTPEKMIEIGIRFEKEIFEKSPNKEQYKHQVAMKLEQLLERRNQNQASMQQQIQQQAQAQAQQQQQQAQLQQQMMMNPNAMQGQGPRPMPQQGAQQSFQHLQHQMQASPLPGQQPPRAPMGIPNQGPANMTPAQQQQFAAMQQGQLQPNVPGRMPNGQPQLSQQDNALIADLTTRLSNQASEDEKNQLRVNLRQRMDAQQFAKYQAQGIDPVLLYFRNQAVNRLRQEKQMRVQQAQQMAMGQQPQNGSASAPPMQQQRSMNPSPLNGQNPPPNNSDFGSFMGNMSDLAAQQAQGAMAQADGQMVVPVSGAPRNGTPQPGAMPGPNMAMNDQRGPANANLGAQQRQHMMNAQAMQQQRMQLAQQSQQQSQAQARMHAQVQAQQMVGLQGQVGGMGPGPVNPQPSPAMLTLNTPMRTPSQQQMSQPDSTPNPNAQFGQSLNPRFMQGNQRQTGPVSAVTQAMLSQMGPEAREQLSQLPAEKLAEVVKRWHTSRPQEMNASGVGRPQIPMQGGGQIRPGQQMSQGGPFNPQNSAAQFMGQRPQPGMPGNMNSQELLQQQMAALRPNAMQQQQQQQNQNFSLEQQMTMQMDGVDVPPVFLNHASMPQGVPPDIKKWGQLKQWAGTNPAVGPRGFEAVKNLQKHHYTSILQRRQQQAHQNGQGIMQPRLQGTPGMGGIAPGLGAPVAPMGQNSIQMPNAMPMGAIRQPTAQEFAALKAHPKLRGANDDQIRQFFLRNQAMQLQNRQNAQQQQAQQQQVMAAQMSRMQAGNQQPSQPANPPTAAPPPKPNQTPQQKPQPPPEAAPATNNPNASRAGKPQPPDRNTAQNSSPAQAPKNLKRSSSSDDVVEVPNPNSQRPQPAAPTSQETSQQGLQRMTPQQVAQLNPEQRKKYEIYLRNQQMTQAATRIQVSPADIGKLKSIEKDEQQKSSGALPDLPMDGEYKSNMDIQLRNLINSMQNINKAMPRWFQITHNEERARQFYHARFRFIKQFQDGERMQQLKGSYSISLQEVGAMKQLINSIVGDLSNKFPNMKKQEPPKPSPAATTQAPSQPPAQPGQAPTPLNAANLQQQQQQLKMHQRSNSRSSHPPAAPTSEQPPIGFGGARSPVGAPTYLNNNTLTQDRMHIPARKKQKQNSTPAALPGQGTPGSRSSPQIPKGASPDMKRHMEARSQSKSLTCPEPECERSNVTFDNQEALELHQLEEHIKPLQDPLKFVQESLTSVSGLDSQGPPKKISDSEPATTAGVTNGVKKMQAASKQGQTPTMKGDNHSAAATPMNRQVSMHRQSSTAGVKSKQQSSTGSAKDASSKANQANPSAPPPTTTDAWATATIDPTELSQFFQPFEAGAGGAISDMNVYRSISPNDTPESSKDGVSEPNSDISDGVALDINLDLFFEDSWQPFGPSDTDPLFDIDNLNGNSALDAEVMFDEDPMAGNFGSWDDVVESTDFDRPFSFDTSLYSMNAN